MENNLLKIFLKKLALTPVLHYSNGQQDGPKSH